MTEFSEAPDIEKQVSDLHEILEITQAMAGEKRLDRLLKVIMEGATRVLGADVSSIFLCDHDTGEFYSRFIQQAVVSEIRFPLDKGIAGYVAKTGETVNIEDAYKDDRFNPDIDKNTGYRTRSILCMPLVTLDKEIIGVTQVLNKKQGWFTAYDEKLLGVFSNNAAVSIDNTLLHEENIRLFKSLISTSSKTIDARDPVTAGHSQRVALYAEQLGRAAGLDSLALNELEVASWLHDIGKIGVRDDVLLKTGRLTDQEYKKIQEHATYTSEILEQIHFSRELKAVPFIASAHHERIDGKGYPYGLVGEKLPLAARILAIVDVYDALTAYDRPYKKAMSVEKALSILEEGRGTQFDAALVDLFISRRCFNIERRQYQRISVDLTFEIVFLSNDDQIKCVEKYGFPKVDDDVLESADANVEEDVDGGTAWDVNAPGKAKGIRVRDISASGLKFETGYYFPINNFVSLKVVIKSIDLTVLCRVIRIRRRPAGTGYIMGVEFVNMKIDEREKLLNYIKSLSSEELQTPIRFL